MRRQARIRPFDGKNQYNPYILRKRLASERITVAKSTGHSALNVLALETSALYGAVACFCGNDLLCEVELGTEQRSARALIPAIKGAISKAAWQPNQIDLIAVTTGPGSFTGLRVGVTTAKTLAYATQAKVIGVNTLDVVAYQCRTHSPLHVVMDAQRKQFFWACYETLSGEIPQMVAEPSIFDQEVWFAERTSDDWIAGPGLVRHKEPACAAQLVAESLWTPTAEAVGRVGMAKFASQGADDLWGLVPNYFRKSAAEEKLGKG